MDNLMGNFESVCNLAQCHTMEVIEVQHPALLLG